MRAIPLDHPIVQSVTIVGSITDPGNDNMDVFADLNDGRRFGFTVFSLGYLARQLERSSSFVSPGMLVVAVLSDAAILDAVRSAAALGIEKFGVLQREP